MSYSNLLITLCSIILSCSCLYKCCMCCTQKSPYILLNAEHHFILKTHLEITFGQYCTPLVLNSYFLQFDPRNTFGNFGHLY